jgi:hypothetical protein
MALVSRTYERAFSRSNAMGGVVHHMSAFHRKQAIVNYFEYTDNMETYLNLSKFSSIVFARYSHIPPQQLQTGILKNLPTTLVRIMLNSNGGCVW